MYKRQEEAPDASDAIPEETQDEIDLLIAQTDSIAMGYDYDKAISLLTDSGQSLTEPRMAQALTRYQSEQAALIPADITQITHIFLHSLMRDASRAVDGDKEMCIRDRA